MIKLYDYELSGNCYKLRLLMGILGIPYETVPVDFYPGREHKSDWFLRINPLGQLPVIEDDGLVLRDAQAILVYLARKYGGEQRQTRNSSFNNCFFPRESLLTVKELEPSQALRISACCRMRARTPGKRNAGVPTGIRTPVLTVKGWCPGPG